MLAFCLVATRTREGAARGSRGEDLEYPENEFEQRHDHVVDVFDVIKAEEFFAVGDVRVGDAIALHRFKGLLLRFDLGLQNEEGHDKGENEEGQTKPSADEGEDEAAAFKEDDVDD